MNAGAIVWLGLSFLVLLVLLIVRGRNGPIPKTRSLPAFQDLLTQAGYAAESGKAIHIALGGGTLYGEDAITSLAGLQVLDALADVAVSYSAPPIVTVGDPVLLPVAQDMLRRAYERSGRAEAYSPSRVQFIAPSPTAYAAGAAYMAASDSVMVNVVAGAFGAEVSLISDASTRRGLPQLAAAVAPDALGALYPATDRLAVGEEMFAASAQINGRRGHLVSLVAHDILRVALVLTILGMAGMALYGQFVR